MSEQLIKATLLVVFVWSLFVIEANHDYDDTDDLINKERSGLTRYKDHGTGCQYLKGGFFGSITPRLDYHGNHVGCK